MAAGEQKVEDPDNQENETIEIGKGHLKMSFSLTSGQLKRMSNTKTGVGSFTPKLFSNACDFCLKFTTKIISRL